MSDSAVLLRLAAQLDEHARAVRLQAGRLGSGTAQLRWHSPAAEAFRARADRATATLHRGALGLEHAASTLRGHARAVRRVEEVTRAVERAGQQIADGAMRTGRTVGGWLT